MNFFANTFSPAMLEKKRELLKVEKEEYLRLVAQVGEDRFGDPEIECVEGSFYAWQYQSGRRVPARAFDVRAAMDRRPDYLKALIAADNITPRGGWRKPHVDLGITPEIARRGRAIWKIRQRRAANRPLSQEDLARAMQTRTVGRIKDRYKEVALASLTRNVSGCEVHTSLDLSRSIALVTVEGWAQYSRRFGARYTKIVVLVIYDRDTHTRRALRVGPSVETIDEALEYLKPAAVRRAEKEGKTVLRQGDFYFVPSRRPNYLALSGTRHEFRDGVVYHPEHGALALPGPCRAYRQMAVVGGSCRGFAWGGSYRYAWGGRRAVGD